MGSCIFIKVAPDLYRRPKNLYHQLGLKKSLRKSSIRAPRDLLNAQLVQKHGFFREKIWLRRCSFFKIFIIFSSLYFLISPYVLGLPDSFFMLPDPKKTEKTQNPPGAPLGQERRASPSHHPQRSLGTRVQRAQRSKGPRVHRGPWVHRAHGSHGHPLGSLGTQDVPLTQDLKKLHLRRPIFQEKNSIFAPNGHSIGPVELLLKIFVMIF